MALGNPTTNDTATTPGRVTRLYLDTDHSSLKQPIFWLRREKSEMAKAGLNDANSENVWRQGHGGISLQPYQQVLHYLSERTDNASAIIPLSSFHYPAGYVNEKQTWRTPTDLTGVTPGSNVASGDSFLRKIVPAGNSWASANLTADATAYAAPTITPANVPMQRLLASKAVYGADQHYTFRWILPGSKIHTPHVVEVFYFGDYAVSVRGNGAIFLLKRASDGSWTQVDDFRYALPINVVGTHHVLSVFPHLDASGGGYITFYTQQEAVTIALQLTTGYFPHQSVPMWHTYRVPRPFPVASPPLTQVTPPAPVRVDTRQDMRVMRQVSLTRYPTTGYFKDEPLSTDMFAPAGQALTLSWEATVPAGCSVTGKIYNAATNSELTLVSSTTNQRVYTQATGQFQYYVRFEFTSDATTTPFLFAYQVVRDGVSQEVTGSEIDASDTIMSLTVTQPENDPMQESVSFRLEDLKNSLTLLSQRGRVSGRLEVQYDPDDDTKVSVLWQGHLVRNPRRRKIGKRNVGMSGSTAQAFPSRLWQEYQCTGVGEALRLKEKMAYCPLHWNQDPLQTSGVAWKVTDVARYMLLYTGYASDEINIPDNPMRLFPGVGGDVSTYLVEPLQNIMDYVTKLLRDYLGWYLVWDANAGTRGKWRALAPKRSPYTSLATFKTTGPANKLSHRPESYGSTGWWSATGSVTTFIEHGTLEVLPKPPEANAVVVYGISADLPGGSGQYQLRQWLINRDGGDFFPSYSVDTTNPDFMGDLVPLVYVDVSLGNQRAVDLVCRRLFDVACKATEIATFEAPMILITDPNDTEQTKPRPLRYYDPVTVDNDGTTRTWLVRSVIPHFEKSVLQMATYELEAVRT